MKKVTKFTDEYISEIAEQKGLIIDKIYHDNDNKGKRRRYVSFLCSKHKEKGIQCIPVEKIESIKKPCKYCSHAKIKETFEEELNIINPTVQLLSKYVNYDTKIKCKCKICENEWSTVPGLLLNGSGCPNCAHKTLWDKRGRITTDIFKKQLEEINPDIEVVGEYISTHDYIECRCKIHNITWKSIACNLKNKSAKCPQCSLEHAVKSYRLTDEEFKKRLSISHPHIKSLEPYITRHTKIKFHCETHNIDFIEKPLSFLYGKRVGCEKCSQSLGEIKLNSIMDKWNINYTTQKSFSDCKYKTLLKYDLYDEDNNIAYEYQGQQHYSPTYFEGITKEKAEKEFELNQKRDNIKRSYCKNNNITLIEIPYWEYDNMEEYIIKELNKINDKTILRVV